MSDLPKKLRIKAGVINMGERIAWGSETALMEEAADLIEQQQAEVDRLSRLHDEWCQVFDQLEEYARANNIGSLGGCRVGGVIESHELQQREIGALKSHLDNFSMAANSLIEFVVDKYGLSGTHELQCPHMIALAAALSKADGDNNE